MSSSRVLRSSACLVALLTAAPLAAQAAANALHTPDRVVLFTTLRENLVRPALAPFEHDTGIRVDVTRASRRKAPKALIAQFAAAGGDVWWCQENLTTDALKRAGAFARMSPRPAGAEAIASRFHDRDGLWFGFAGRARVIVVNTDRVPVHERPTSLWDLLNPRWKGLVGLARPTSGTTLFHLLALRQALGEAQTERYLEGLRQNDCQIVDGDRRLAEKIGAGELLVGMTDTSDCRAVQAAGMPVEAIYPDQDGVGTLVVPNTLALLATSSHPANARRLLTYLLSGQAERILAAEHRGQFPLRGGVEHPTDAVTPAELKVMDIDLGQAAARADTFGASLRRRYPRLSASASRAAKPTGTIVVDFDDMPLGVPPAGMTVAQTGNAPPCAWNVTADATSHGGGHVLTQTEATDGRRFPLCIYDGFEATDVSVGVRFKTMTGNSDRAAGLCVRYLDENNYYCCRANSLEDNYRFYRIVGGHREELAGVDRFPILENLWQTMRLEAKGSHFRIWMNGNLVFEADDDTFAGPGKVGLWLKGDSVTSFDDLTISAPAVVRGSDFETDGLGHEPSGFLTRSPGQDQAVAWRVTGIEQDGHVARAVTPDPQQGEGHHRGGCVLLDAATTAADVSVSTRFKVATTGRGMHLAGLVARYQNSGAHYYYLRINPEECNLRLYRMSDGKRTLVGERHHTRFDEHAWHRARLTAIGPRLQVLIDGELQFVAHDTSLPTAGRAGVWAAPGGDTLYDEITVDAFE